MDKDEVTETKISLNIDGGTLILNASLDHRGLDLLSKILVEVRSFMGLLPHER